MTLGRLGENKTSYLVVPCGHPSDTGGLLRSPWHARTSVQVQLLRPERRQELPKVA